MAYQTPPQWAHGDIPTGAQMQKYSDALNALKTFTDQLRWNAAGVTGQTGVGGSQWAFVHVHRYLAFDGTGEIVDPDDEDNTVGLSDPDSGWGHYDLSSVGWIYPGKMYFVTGCDGCFEVWWV